MPSEASDLPEAAVVIDHLAPEPDLHAAMKAVVKQLLPQWAPIPDTSIEVTVVSGGISNALYKLSPSSLSSDATEKAHSGETPVLVRVYGAGTEKFVDRRKEVGVMRLLRSHGFGPALLGLFANGRLESFLPLRCLTPEEMAAPGVAPTIAATLARFHAVDAEHAPAAARTPFERIREWLAIARGLDFSDDPEKAAAHAALDFGAMEAAVAEVEAAAAPLASPVVFSHNDLLSGNIMAAPAPLAAAAAAAAAADEKVGPDSPSQPVFSPQSLTFIDFEYADWAPRGFDLGNHFCEYAGFECDYGRYPCGATARAFLRSYLSAARACAPEAVSAAELGRAVADANVHALAAHQYWGTWALMQARWSAIDFDYMGYAALRWGEFERRREEFLGQARAAAAAADGGAA